MCRLFGFRSVIQSQVHSSLVGAENSFMTLSSDHPDGWGVAYYIEGSPHVMKSESSAINDHLFQRVSGLVASQTVLAHLRKATLGTVNVANTHPFQYGNWVFAHNGNINQFDAYRDELMNLIPAGMRRFILGNTDSEVIFFIILAELARKVSLRERSITATTLVEAIKLAVKRICDLIGPYERQHSDPGLTYLTFIITNGEAMAAHHGGQPLWYSTYKNKCPDRETCTSFNEVCESPSRSGYVNHLLFSSEQIDGENLWQEMLPGAILATDQTMMMTYGRSAGRDDA